MNFNIEKNNGTIQIKHNKDYLFDVTLVLILLISYRHLKILIKKKTLYISLPNNPPLNDFTIHFVQKANIIST